MTPQVSKIVAFHYKPAVHYQYYLISSKSKLQVIGLELQMAVSNTSATMFSDTATYSLLEHLLISNTNVEGTLYISTLCTTQGVRTIFSYL